MSRREQCKGSHDWVPRECGAGFRCSRCPALFPCATDCAHHDCVEARGTPPNCGTCNKPVSMDEASFTSRGDKLIAHHPTCVTSTKAEIRLEGSTDIAEPSSVCSDSEPS